MTGPRVSPDVVWQESEMPRAERWQAGGAHGATVWLTGLSGSGKSTIAAALAVSLVAQGVLTYSLDGDNLRHGLNRDLGFSADDRAENVRRVGEVARLCADAGLVVCVPIISPYRAGREHARAIHETSGLVFLETFVDAPLAVCEDRDPKGLYRKARAGQLPGFTGVDDPYEAPDHPDLVLDTAELTPPHAAAVILEALQARGVVA